ncbi:sugar kinase [Cohnella sp. CIP 111063]|uniref:ROK family protein n=1 Tax=unclassified Cohnella TaxID=2636738 RepID=UPI000B8C1D2D|nr:MULTISPECIES: ROK family protein [unclassified Cohnella]OXS55647.1 sugar kinase [Cohnella sp. CIP 111063]PRX66494.1 glucokinase [Cohnella sp. SGD-V74]
MNVTIGVDVGGTNIVCGATDEAGKVLRKLKRPTEAHAGHEAVLGRIAEMVAQIREELGAGIRVTSVGVGIPGLVDPLAGVSKFAGNLKWRDIPVAGLLGEQIGLPVFIDNDVRMYIYGEAVAGAGQGYEHVLGITIGTGIAAAIVNGGELYYGHKALAGELGHVRMDGVEEDCACGLSGCLETVASASGLVRQAKKALREGRESLLNEWFPGEALEQLTAADLSKAMDAGDELAADIIVRAGKLNGRALAAAALVLSPDVIVVGGGGALAGERLMAPLREELYRLLLPDFREGLKVVTAEHNDDAGIIGSSLYAAHRNGA